MTPQDSLQCSLGVTGLFGLGRDGLCIISGCKAVAGYWGETFFLYVVAGKMVPGFCDALTHEIDEEELQCSSTPPQSGKTKKRTEQVECVLFAHSSRIPEFHIRQSVGNRLITEWSRAKPKANQPGEDSVS